MTGVEMESTSAIAKQDIKGAAGDQQVNILGVFRSGTNLTKSVLDTAFGENFYFNKTFWKHQIIPTDVRIPANTHFILVVKNPLHQMVSWFTYARWAKHAMVGAADFLDFVKSPIRISARFGERPHYYFSSPVEYWNQYYYTALSVCQNAPGRYAMVRYEDVMRDPASVVQVVSRFLGRAPLASDPRIPLKKLANLPGTLPFDEARDVTKATYDRGIVDDQKYLRDFDDATIRFVTEGLIPELRHLYPQILGGGGTSAGDDP